MYYGLCYSGIKYNLQLPLNFFYCDVPNKCIYYYRKTLFVFKGNYLINIKIYINKVKFPPEIVKLFKNYLYLTSLIFTFILPEYN